MSNRDYQAQLTQKQAQYLYKLVGVELDKIEDESSEQYKFVSEIWWELFNSTTSSN